MHDFRRVMDVADYLSQMEGEEYNRSAISRYYYSVFGCTRLYLILILKEYEFCYRNDIHKRICERLANSNDDTEKSLGNSLDKLRELRNLADYDWYEKDAEFFMDNLHYVRSESLFGIEQLESLKQFPPYEV